MKVINRIKKLRDAKNLTLRELSIALDKKGAKISPDALAKYERDERQPKIDKWEALANFFGVSVPYLQGCTEETYHNSTKEQQTMKHGLLIKLVTKETILLVDHNQEKNSLANMNEFIEYSFIQGYGIEDYNPFMSFSQRDVKELYINLDNILYVKQVKYELKK